jgi:RNA polymerase sigma-70 factor (ECF subfamily)
VTVANHGPSDPGHDGVTRRRRRRAASTQGGRCAESALARSRDDPAAFDAFYAQHVRQLLVFFARRILDAEAALDLTAETFAQAYAGRRGFRGDGDEDARAWLYTIAHRRLARFLRVGYADRRARDRLGIEARVAQDAEIDHVERLASFDALRRRVGGALDTLPADQREAVRLRIVEDLAYPEVAARVGATEDAVRARVSRGLRALRALLAEAGPGGTDP